jgi:hypothetical protein
MPGLAEQLKQLHRAGMIGDEAPRAEYKAETVRESSGLASDLMALNHSAMNDPKYRVQEDIEYTLPPGPSDAYGNQIFNKKSEGFGPRQPEFLFAPEIEGIANDQARSRTSRAAGISRDMEIASLPYRQMITTFIGDTPAKVQDKLKNAARLEMEARDKAVLDGSLPKELSSYADDFMFRSNQRGLGGNANKLNNILKGISTGEPMLSDEARSLVNDAREMEDRIPKPPPPAKAPGRLARDLAIELSNYVLMSKAVGAFGKVATEASSTLGGIASKMSPAAKGAATFGAIEGAKAGEEGAKHGALLGYAMGAGHSLGTGAAGVVGASVGGGAATGALGGDPKDIALMAAFPVVFGMASGVPKAFEAASGRAARVAIENNQIALEAGKRSQPGQGGPNETVFDVGKRLAGKAKSGEPVSRKDLPTVKDARSRAQIAQEVREAMDAQDRLNKRTDEIKEQHKNKKTRERKLREDPVILEQLSKLRDWMTKSESERASDRNEASRVSAQGWLEFEADVMDELGVRAGVVDALEYANKWSRTKPEPLSLNEPNLNVQSPLPDKPSGPPIDMGEGIFTSPSEAMIQINPSTRQAEQARKQPGTGWVPTEAAQYGPDAARMISANDTLEFIKKGAAYTQKKAVEYLTRHGGKPEIFGFLDEKKKGRVAKELRMWSFASRDLEKDARIAYGGTPSRNDRAIMNKVLVGDLPESSVPKEVRVPLRAMRKHVDRLSQELIDAGVVSGDLAQTISDNKGTYLHRSYRAFGEPKWSERVDPAVKTDMENFLLQNNPQWTQQQAQQYVNELLYTASQSSSLMDAMASGTFGQKDLTSLKARKNLPIELRRLWGEIDDPIENYRRTISKQSNLIANHHMLRELRDVGMGTMFWVKGDPNTPIEASAPIKPGDYRLEPIAGLRTFPEIEQIIKNYGEAGIPDGWVRWMIKGSGIVKAGKTIYSPKTQMRNFGANPAIMVANGNLFLRGFVGAMKDATADFLDGGDVATRKRLERMHELNLVGDSASFGEMREIMRDISNRGGEALDDVWSGRTHGWKKKPLTSAKNFAAKTYQFGDDVWKILEFQDKFKKYRSRIPKTEIPDSDLEVKIADMVRDTVPTYSRVPKLVRDLRRVPFLGPFPAFYWEMFRTTYHRNRIMAQELKDPRLRSIGAARAAGQVVAMGTSTAVSLGSAQLVGMNLAKRDALREFLAPWDSDSDLMYLNRGDDGVVSFINLSYTDPFKQYKETARAGMRGDDPVDKAIDVASRIVEPFVSEEILSKAILDIRSNKNSDTGGPIVNMQDDRWEIAKDAFAYITKAVEPGGSADIRREYYAQMGYKTYTGSEYPKFISLLSMATGVKMQKIDVRTAAGFRARQFVRDTREVENILRKPASNQGEVSDADIANAYERMEKNRERLFSDMQKKVEALWTLGLEDSEIRTILTDSGVSRRTASDLLKGEYRPWNPPSRYLRRRDGSLDDRRKMLRDMARETRYSVEN